MNCFIVQHMLLLKGLHSTAAADLHIDPHLLDAAAVCCCGGGGVCRWPALSACITKMTARSGGRYGSAERAPSPCS